MHKHCDQIFQGKMCTFFFLKCVQMYVNTFLQKWVNLKGNFGNQLLYLAFLFLNNFGHFLEPLFILYTSGHTVHKREDISQKREHGLSMLRKTKQI